MSKFSRDLVRVLKSSKRLGKVNNVVASITIPHIPT